MANILTFDLETVGQIGSSSYGQIVTWAAKWLDHDEVMVKDLRDFKKSYKAEPWDSTQLLAALADVIDQSDMVVTFFGKGFDWPMVQTPLTKVNRFLKPVPHIDLYYVNKLHHKIGRGSLDAALTYFELEEQKFHLSPLVWRKAMRGNSEAMDLLKERCASDVRATEYLYLKLRPLIQGHPRLAAGDKVIFCNKCGSKTERRGTYVTSAGRIRQRVKCTSLECGGWGTV
jgi:DNA polymerase elongation subunit (family B)